CRSARGDAPGGHQADDRVAVNLHGPGVLTVLRAWRKSQREGGTAAGIVRYRNRALQRGHDVLDDGQSQAGTLAISIPLPEPLKDLVAFVGRHPGPAIDHLDCRLLRETNADGGAGRRVRKRVFNQVAQGGTQGFGVGLNEYWAGAVEYFELLARCD